MTTKDSCKDFISLHIRSMWETICDAQAYSCTHSSNSKFLSKFSRKPLSGISDQKAPLPPISENFRFEMTKVYSEIHPPFQKTSDLRWPKFTPKYPHPPISENFRFEMTKVYSEISPHFGKLQIWGDQSLLQNTPPFGKLQIWDDQSLLWNIPHFGKLQIWGDQSLLQNTPPFGKLQIWDDQSLLWNTPPPHFRKLQIWDDQSLLQNTPPFWKTSDLRWPKFTPKYPPPP